MDLEPAERPQRGLSARNMHGQSPEHVLLRALVVHGAIDMKRLGCTPRVLGTQPFSFDETRLLFP